MADWGDGRTDHRSAIKIPFPPLARELTTPGIVIKTLVHVDVRYKIPESVFTSRTATANRHWCGLPAIRHILKECMRDFR